MSFGRQNNMVRRPLRPNEAHLRDQRRKGNSKGLMLEAGLKKRRSWLGRIFAAPFRRAG